MDDETLLTPTADIISSHVNNNQIAARNLPGWSSACTRRSRALAKARPLWDELAEGQIRIEALARREGVSSSYLSRVVRLALLTPAVVEAILDGRARADVTGATLLQTDAIPESWQEQEARWLIGVTR